MEVGRVRRDAAVVVVHRGVYDLRAVLLRLLFGRRARHFGHLPMDVLRRGRHGRHGGRRRRRLHHSRTGRRGQRRRSVLFRRGRLKKKNYNNNQSIFWFFLRFSILGWPD